MVQSGLTTFGGSFIPLDVNTRSDRYVKLESRCVFLSMCNQPGVARRMFVQQKSLLSANFAAKVPRNLCGDAWLDAVEAAMKAEVFRNRIYNRVQWLRFENKQHTTVAEVKPYLSITDSLKSVFG